MTIIKKTFDTNLLDNFREGIQDKSFALKGQLDITNIDNSNIEEPKNTFTENVKSQFSIVNKISRKVVSLNVVRTDIHDKN